MNAFFPSTANLNIPLQIGKYTPRGTYTPGWVPLI